MAQEAPATQPENLAASLSPMRQELVQWFEREAPSLAPAYRAAIQILKISAMPARVHLVSHIVRDIYGKLPEILDGEYRRTNAGELYRSLVDKVEGHWGQSKGTALHGENRASTDVAAAAAVAVSVAAARSVDDLLERHRRLKEQPRSAVVLARAMYRRFAESGLEAPRRLVDQFERERVWFTKRAHLVIEMEKVPSDDGLMEHFAAFERALYSLVGQYFTGKTEIDAILQQANR